MMNLAAKLCRDRISREINEPSVRRQSGTATSAEAKKCSEKKSCESSTQNSSAGSHVVEDEGKEKTT